MKRSEVDLTKVTPAMRQYLEIKEANPDVVLLKMPLQCLEN